MSKTRLLVILLTMLFAVQVQAQDRKITMSIRNEALPAVFNRLENSTSYKFNYVYKDVESYRVTARIKNEDINGAMGIILNGLPLRYTVKGKIVNIVKTSPRPVRREKQLAMILGTVVDENNEPVIGATIKVTGTNTVSVTKPDGTFYVYAVPGDDRLEVSYVGMKTVMKTAATDMHIVMHSDESTLKDVIVTGIYSRDKESFTGSAATYTQKDLKNMGSTNVLQSLKTLDPSFAIIDNTSMGSDPNHLPNMEIRGKSSMLGLRDDISNDPNQPLFILDGFESTLEAINDIDINRVQSITILKDAASTAIYGSKAANGVVVVETVKPQAGKLQVSYTGNINISVPDLSSYNMMDAAEKLEFERLAGRYDASIVETPYQTREDLMLTQAYHDRLRAIARGVNTDWLAQPLHVGVDHKHSLYVQGGNENFMFGIGGQYNGNTGVMKGSDRRVYTGNIDLIYRVSQFQFSNKFTLSNADYHNPLVSFDKYVRANPYYAPYGENGQLMQFLERSDEITMANPLWDASLNSYDKGNDLQITDYFQAEWTPNKMWKVRAKFGVTYDDDGTRKFTSPDNTSQVLNKTLEDRGEYYRTDGRSLQYQGDLSVTFAKVFNDIHQVNAVAGGNVYHNKTTIEGYGAEGFPSGDFTLPSFASKYIENGVPTYTEAISRSVNAYLNAGYSLLERYLLDLSLRENGSSVFGTSHHWNTTWSVGLGWNIHNEPFIKRNFPVISYMKLRASIGNPGNQSFDSGATMITYALKSGVLNYFGLGALPNQIGNPNLKWQITQDKNVGLDLSLFNNRLNFTVDYFHKSTDPLLINVTMPYSSGTTQYFTNAGKQISQGLTFTANYYILRDTGRRLFWQVRANGRTQWTKLDNIGNQLDNFNNNGRGSYTTRYFDGADPDDIWLVRSAGIDPSTGKEIFYKKDGTMTYDFSYDDEVNVGNTRPDLEGVIGSNFTWGGFSASLNFRYQLGADVFNTALMNKVENVDYNYNQDRRALYERWTKPGDVVSFKNIRDVNPSPMSSRFLQTERTLSLESVNIQYEWFQNSWIRHLGLGSLKVFAQMRDVFRLSTIKAERGTSYPYAKTIEAGLSLNF